jgi:hypothetical protein
VLAGQSGFKEPVKEVAFDSVYESHDRKTPAAELIEKE